MTWTYSGKAVSFDGTVNYYQSEDTDYTIESRKRKVAHTNREGYWWHTSFFVIKDGKEVAEKATLRDAKDLVEILEKQKTGGKTNER